MSAAINNLPARSGRARLAPAARRGSLLGALVTDEERDLIHDLAAARGTTVSGLLRALALDAVRNTATAA